MRGNKTNHPKKYAQQEDLKELKVRFFSFLDNDWVHLKTKVARQEGILYIILTILGIVLAKVLGAWWWMKAILNLITRLKKLGFELKANDEDWIWILQKENEEFIAQVAILRKWLRGKVFL